MHAFLRRSVVLAGLTLGWTGCSLFTSLSDLSSGAGGEGGGDGAVDGDASGANDGVSDSGSDDAAGNPDGRPPRWCDGVDATFCDDFDHGDDSRWQTGQTNGAASQRIDQDGGRSMPASLLGVVEANSSRRVERASRRVSFPGHAKTATVSFWVLMEERAATSDDGLCYVDLTMRRAGNDSYGVYINVGERSDVLGVTRRRGSNSPPNDFMDISPRLPTGTWSNVVFDVRQVQSGGYTLTLTVDGAKRLTDQPLAHWSDATPDSGIEAFEVSLGVIYRGAPADPYRFRIDDVQIDITN